MGSRVWHGRIAAVTCAALLLFPRSGEAQFDLSGYALGVGSWARASSPLPAGSSWFGRGRLMAEHRGDRFGVDVAWEQVGLRQPVGGGFGFTNPSGLARSTDWVPLDWTLHEGDRGSWRHRFDRLALSLTGANYDVTMGRQAISWATTLFLTPADPFSPFDPADPFREYRGGVDAIRARFFTGPFTEFEVVARAAETRDGTTTTALARVSTAVSDWAVGGWAGVLHDAAAAAVFTTGSIGATSLRGEASLRRDTDGSGAPRLAMGIDRFWQPGGRSLFVLIEVQYDAFGAAMPSELLLTAASDPYGRGEMQVLGRWALATQASWQLHPLVGVDLLGLVNPDDGSLLLSPGLSWSATARASVRLGGYAGYGTPLSTTFAPGSEYGLVPDLGYLAISFFF